MKFALIGAAGYVAPRHMKAIKENGHELVAALDPNDSVGIIDSYFPDAHFFTEFERFDRHLEKLRRRGEGVDFVSICSPNYLHDSHIRFGLRIGASVICEKPMVLNPWNVEALMEIENEYPGNVYNILQLRHHPSVIQLRDIVQKDPNKHDFEVDLKYYTSRGRWYQVSWKGDEEKSGGIASNIGVHFFDMLLWIFGDVVENKVIEHSNTRARGVLRLKRATINWDLGIDADLIPHEIKSKGGRTYRSLMIGNDEFEFSGGFEDLHNVCYQEILKGRGYGLTDALPSIRLVSEIRQTGQDKK